MPDGVERSPARGNEALQIGDWTVEPALNRLSAGGKTLKLEPKAMALLRYLAERPGQVVSREALLSAVWPGVVVGDDSLTQAVIKLRKALGDVAEAPAYIQTIQKGGYRLVAPIKVTDGTAVEAIAPTAEPSRAVSRRRISWLAGAGVAAVVLAAAAAWWAGAGDRVAPPLSTTASAEESRTAQPTVTIEPFEALGDDAQAVLLARGITVDLVVDLSRISGLAVVSSVRSPRPAAEANREEARPARYVVSGSVQRIDDRLRLYVHLTDAQNGKQIWSERFERPLAALFAMQEELGPKILQTLPAKVSEAELRRTARPHTPSLEAYEHFQRGQMALLVRQQAENEIAREMFQRAIALDATFARAYAALALTYAADYRNNWTRDGPAALQRAFELARTAHEINPELRETYWVLAFVHLERRQHNQSMQYLESAIRLSPSFADAYALMGGIHAYTGRPANTLPLLRTAMRLNPEAGYLYFLILGRAYLGLGDLEQARVNLEHALMRNPANIETRVYMAATHLAAGDKAAASWEAEEIRQLQPAFSSQAWLATHPLTDAKVHARLVQTFAALSL